jgi:RimJ/RimL family protein N-acetyltransferase
VSVTIRRATPEDVDFLHELMTNEEVDPFLAARRATTREEIAEDVERSQREPDKHGRFVVEWERERAGTMGFSVANERSRIAHLSGLAVHPDFRGRRISDEAARQLQRHLIFDLGYHRLQLEIYGFNERALRHAERAGYVREGVKRKAYWRHGEWVDGVLFGLIREDLEESTEEERMEPQDEARIQDTAQEFDEVRGDDAEGMQEQPDESREKDERRGDS